MNQRRSNLAFMRCGQLPALLPHAASWPAPTEAAPSLGPMHNTAPQRNRAHRSPMRGRASAL